MATNYTELQTEIQRWLDNDNPNLVAEIPTFITDAEKRLNRHPRFVSLEMEATYSTPLVASGDFALPADWSGQRLVKIVDPNLVLLYYQDIPALSGGSPTNWLLTRHPDLYRYMALTAAESFLKNDPRMPLWKAQASEIIEEVHRHYQETVFSGHPLHTRTLDERPWRKSVQGNGVLEYLAPFDFDQLRLSPLTRSDDPYQGYYTVTENQIRIWPLPEVS